MHLSLSVIPVPTPNWGGWPPPWKVVSLGTLCFQGVCPPNVSSLTAGLRCDSYGLHFISRLLSHSIPEFDDLITMAFLFDLQMNTF